MNKSPCLTLSFALGIALSLTNAYAADLSGRWSGTWTKAGDALTVSVTFVKTGDTYSGSFDSDDLQVAGIPFAEVALATPRVHLVLKGDESSTIFDGALTGDALTGTFVDGPVKGTFALKRAATPSPTLRSRDAAFNDGAVKLSGELLIPESSGRHPAVLFLHGSGPEGRWASRYLARKFAEQGFVGLVYDKRGVGGSSGDWQSASFEDLADDAATGVRFLAALPEVDPTHIGVYGHSQGGTVAPLVATRAGNLSFVIASAAPGLDPAATEIYSVENSLGVSGLAEPDRSDAKAYVRELVDVAYHGKSHDQLTKMAASFEKRPWFFPPPPPENSYWTLSRKFAAFRPAAIWRQVHTPVLLLYGAHDQRVPPAASADAIAGALRSGGNGKVTVRTFAQADHTFTLVDPPPAGGWPKHVPNYADIIVAWARAQ